MGQAATLAMLSGVLPSGEERAGRGLGPSELLAWIGYAGMLRANGTGQCMAREGPALAVLTRDRDRAVVVTRISVRTALSDPALLPPPLGPPLQSSSKIVRDGACGGPATIRCPIPTVDLAERDDRRRNCRRSESRDKAKTRARRPPLSEAVLLSEGARGAEALLTAGVYSMFETLADLLPHLRDGRLRPIRMAAAGRQKIVPARPRGGAEGDRTPDLLIANEALSQLSYSPGPTGGPNMRMRPQQVKHRLPRQRAVASFRAAEGDGGACFFSSMRSFPS